MKRRIILGTLLIGLLAVLAWLAIWLNGNQSESGVDATLTESQQSKRVEKPSASPNGMEAPEQSKTQEDSSDPQQALETGADANADAYDFQTKEDALNRYGGTGRETIRYCQNGAGHGSAFAARRIWRR